MRGAGILRGYVVADGTARNGAENGVVVEKVSGDAAGDSTLDAALGLGGLQRHDAQRSDQGKSGSQCLHVSSPVGHGLT